MGVKLKGVAEGETIALSDLQGKVLAVDTYNILYQFLTTIRGPDGSYLTNEQGVVTSHLIGLFNRVAHFMKQNIKLVFVFDGKHPELKRAEQEKRKLAKINAEMKLNEAQKSVDLEQMRKYSTRTARLTKEMIEQAKELIRILGFPIVDAASEGEAQCAHLVSKGEAYATLSQDYDSLVYGSERMVKNLSIAGRRRGYGGKMITIEPTMIKLSSVLNALGLDHDQFIVLAILTGTDFNPSGVKGIGPKKAEKLIKEHGKDFAALFSTLSIDFDWKEIFDLMKHMPISTDYTLTFSDPDFDAAEKLLVDKYGFSSERVQKTLADLREEKKQKGLSSFMG